MPPAVATFVFVVGILGLFVLDGDENARTSKALWIPVVWLLINGSRPVSVWLGIAPQVQTPDQYLDGSPIDRLVFLVLLVAGLIVLLRRSRQVGTLLRQNWPILLFFSYCAASILWSGYPIVAFKRWTKAVGDLVMVLIVLTDFEPKAAFKRFLARSAFILIPASVLLIKYYPGLGIQYNVWSWAQEFDGVTTTKNMLGMICLICGLASVWRFFAAYSDREDTRRTRRLIAHGSVIVMVLWLFWKSNSVTSMSCFAMAGGLIVMTSLSRWARKPAIVHVLIAAMVFISFFALFLNPGGGLVEDLGRNPTLTGRTDIWKVVLSSAGNPMLGTGFESFWLGDRLQKMWSAPGGFMKGIQEAHNGYLEVYLNLGAIGVLLLAVLLVAGYRNVLAVFRRERDIGAIRLAFFVTAVVYSFTEAGFRMMSPTWIAFLLATTAVPEVAVPEDPPPLVIGPTNRFAKRESEVAHLVGAEFRRGAF